MIEVHIFFITQDSIPSSSSGFSSRGSGGTADANKCKSGGVCPGDGAECKAVMADSMSSTASTASTADHEDRERERARGDKGDGDKGKGKGVENKAFVKEEGEQDQEEDNSESRQVT